MTEPRTQEGATPDEMEARADALDAYGNSLPDGVTTEAFAEAANLRHEAKRLRESKGARDSGISSLAKHTIRHWFERRHRGEWEHGFALHSIKDAQLHRRLFRGR